VSVGKRLQISLLSGLAMAIVGGAAGAEPPPGPTNAVAAFYPPDALAKGVAGEAALRCDVDRHFRPIKCKVLSETPQGYGFGEAALKVAESIPGNPKVVLDDKSKWFNGPMVFRFTPNPPSISPPPLEPPHIITNVDWLVRPDGSYLAKKYPQLAAGPPGRVTLQCSVTVDGRLIACDVIEESPPGRGLAAAALDWASQQKMKPKTLDGVPQDGGRFQTSIRFGRP
jgi:TonB family protein